MIKSGFPRCGMLQPPPFKVQKSTLSLLTASSDMNSSYSSELEDTPENRKKIFYKQKLIEGYDEERDITFDQTLIVTYSLTYKLYQQTVRNRQIERAKKYLEHPSESDRWEIEESFRIMKSEFDARPVYLQRDDRIKSHFLTCFISLMIYRIL